MQTYPRRPLLGVITNSRSLGHKRFELHAETYLTNLYFSSMEKYPVYWPQFYTATILEWKPLLNPDKYKQIIIESLQYLTTNKKITLYAFVIMNNHIHLIWQALPGNIPEKYNKVL
jgi:hypothetical protein